MKNALYKRLLSGVVCLSMALSLAGCGTQSQSAPTQTPEVPAQTEETTTAPTQEASGSAAADGTYTGRTYMDAPEVDGQISFTAGRRLRAGEFVPVRVTGAQEYDLTGEMIE